MVCRLHDLKNPRRKFLRHRKQPGGRKDQRFRERSLNDDSLDASHYPMSTGTFASVAQLSSVVSSLCFKRTWVRLGE